jgi:chemotaxis protein methyltransferase CheR
MFRKQFTDVQDAFALAHAIVDTVREPLVVLDDELRVVAASRSFYLTFKVDRDATQGKLLFKLGNGAWDIPKLRLLLAKIIPEHGEMEDYEVEHDFPDIGQRTMLLNARRVFYEVGSHANIILLGIEDVTGKRALEREKDELLRQKDVLLDEIEHRVTNSLQIIASIILMKAKSVDSEETRRHLHDAHKRVISVAVVQRHLHASAAVGSMEMQPYLTRLCEALSHSMIGDERPVLLQVVGEGGIATCRNAESLGLIVTELVMNSLKYAFNTDKGDGRIMVSYEVSGTDWKLSVADNGAGKPHGIYAQPKSGLGTGIVKALAKQLDARVETVSGDHGTMVSVTHATFGGRAPLTLTSGSVMDYCGVEFTAVEIAATRAWKWQLSILDTDKMKSSGEAPSRAAAIKQAREAIGEGLRAGARPDRETQLWQSVHDVLGILHGARSLPPAEAIAALSPFLNTMRDRASGSGGLAHASAAAVSELVQRLQTAGIASDDLWEDAIEMSLSFANEASQAGAR